MTASAVSGSTINTAPRSTTVWSINSKSRPTTPALGVVRRSVSTIWTIGVRSLLIVNPGGGVIAREWMGVVRNSPSVIRTASRSG